MCSINFETLINNAEKFKHIQRLYLQLPFTDALQNDCPEKKTTFTGKQLLQNPFLDNFSGCKSTILTKYNSNTSAFLGICECIQNSCFTRHVQLIVSSHLPQMNPLVDKD